jgi:ABC-type sugar transport system substrate-binding protein
MDPAVLDQAIKAAHDKGIPISTFYNEPATKANPHVQINEIVTSRQMGVLAAKKWKEFYPNIPIKVGLIDYLNVEHAMQQRSNPFIEGVKSVDPKAEVVTPRSTSSTGPTLTTPSRHWQHSRTRAGARPSTASLSPRSSSAPTPPRRNC